MSRGLTAGPHPKAHRTNSPSDRVRRSQDAAVAAAAPRRKPRRGRGPAEIKGANDHSETSALPESSSDYGRPEEADGPSFRFRRFGVDFAGSSKRPEFRKYYPKVRGDFSDDSRQSRTFDKGSGVSEDVPSSGEHTGAFQSTESESRSGQRRSTPVGRGCSVISTRTVGCLSSNYEGTPQQSSKSGLSADSRTYTLHSPESNADSIPEKASSSRLNDSHDERNVVEEGEWKLDRAPLYVYNKLQSVGEDVSQAFSTVNCFARLYKRIETLEDLLQQTLGQSTQPIKSKGKVQAENEEEVVQEKASDVPLPVIGNTRPSEAQNIAWAIKEIENSDTELELRNIKKRLRVLERKLKDGKKSNKYESSGFKGVTLTEGEAGGELISKNGACRNYSVLNCFLCRQRGLSLAEKNYFVEHLCEKEVVEKQKGEVKHKKFLSKYRSLKNKCSTLMSSATAGSRRKNQIVKIPRDDSDTPFEYSCNWLESPLKEQENKRSATRVTYVKRCPLEPKSDSKHQRKRKRKKQNTHRKASRGNLHWLQSRGASEMETSQRELESGGDEIPFASGDLKPSGDGPGKKMSIAEDLCDLQPTFDSSCWTPYPLWIPFKSGYRSPFHRNHRVQWKESNHECATETEEKTKKERRIFRNPLDMLRRGGKIKIPVLFEELCKTGGTEKATHKASNMSMRFVLVEEDDKNPLTPLRKLIKKLSQTHSTKRTEQYVFGVSKCCCENKMRGLDLFPNKNVLDKFGFG